MQLKLHWSDLFTRKSVEILQKIIGQFRFSKIYERYIRNFLIPYINKYLSEFVAAYKKSYSPSHVLIRLVENWKKELDKKYVGAIIIDLSKAFDCILKTVKTSYIPLKSLLHLRKYSVNQNKTTFL